jgi:hypothetical protein
LITVLQSSHPVTGHDRGAKQLAHASEELGVVDGKLVRQLVANLPFSLSGCAGKEDHNA